MPEKRLRHAAYSQTKERPLHKAFAEGYREARFKKSLIRVGSKANRAEVHLVLDTGPSFHTEQVTVVQDPFLRTGQRMIPLSASERLTSDRFLNLKRALSNSDYFERPSVDIAQDKARPHCNPKTGPQP